MAGLVRGIKGHDFIHGKEVRLIGKTFSKGKKANVYGRTMLIGQG
jgi:hypothetical protein